MANHNLYQRFLVELLGTFLFVLVGAGSVIAATSLLLPNGGGLQLVVIALANGIGLAIAVSIGLGISGGLMNPAITIGFWVVGRLKAADALAYILAQVAGAIVAGFILVTLFPYGYGVASHYGTPTLASGISVLQGIGLEAVMTFVLVLAVFGTTVDKRAPKIGGFGVGLTVAAIAMAIGPFTGAAMNPARWIGPAIASLTLANWYVYWIGPIIGAVLAALIYEYGLLRHKR